VKSAKAATMAGSLPRASEAAVDPAKFVDYSMNPANPGNQGKWIAFAELGYDVSTPEGRRVGFAHILQQVTAALPCALAGDPFPTPYGSRYRVKIEILGLNQKKGTLVTVWQVDKESLIPRLVTNWLEVHNDE
jgi:hypothetical protein